jgi:hypothetical protein
MIRLIIFPLVFLLPGPLGARILEFFTRLLPIKTLNSRSYSGQATFEYIFLLAAILFISIALLKGVNSNLGNFWLYIIRQIAYPTTGIDFR